MTRLSRVLLLAALFSARLAFADCSRLGDYTPGQVIDCIFDTKTGAGAGATLGGTPVVSVYKGNSLTQSTAGVTLDVDYDSATGLNHLRIDTSADGTFYSSGAFFSIVVTTGTVSGSSIAPATVGGFTLGASAAYARLGAPAGASVSADIDNVLLAVDNVNTNVVGIPETVMRQSPADFASEPGTLGQVVDTLSGDATAIKGATDQLTFTVPNQVDANALSGGGGATAAEVWDYLVSAASTSSSMGALIASKLGLLTSGTRITIADPVQETTVSIVPGTAYTGTRQPKLTWPIAASERDLTGATVKLVVTDGDTALLTVTGSVASAGTESQALEFAVTAAQSALLTRIGAASYRYQLNATWAGDSPTAPVRLFEGDVDSRTRYQ